MGICDYFPDIQLRVAKNREELEKLEKWFDVTFEEPSKDGGTYLLDKDDAECLVVFIKPRKSCNNAALAALIAHEAVHCMQFYMNSIGEEKPSTEFQAYVVQAYTQEIIERCSDLFEEVG